MSAPPWKTWVRPVPAPPPWTSMVAPGHAATNCFAAASTTGCSAVEPRAVILPSEQVTAAAPPVESLASVLAAELYCALGATLGAIVAPPPLLQAPNANAAATASAPMRFVLMITRWFLLRGLGRAT